MIGRATEYGYDGVEIGGKRPHGNPMDLSDCRCREIRETAAGEGIEIYAEAANNDFSSPVPEQRESQLAYVRDLVRMTAGLGAKLLGVFAAWQWPGVTVDGESGRCDIAQRIWRTAQ